VQSVGKIPVSVRALGVDTLALSAHKFGGPKGIGALWVRRGVRLMAQMTGGRQERGRRGGTENVPAIVGLGIAAAIAADKLAATAPRLAALRDWFEQTVLDTVPGTAINGDRTARVPNTTNIGFEGIEAESLLIALDLEGIAVSTGSACSSGSLEPSHVLRAMGLPNVRARNSLRFSLGPATTRDELELVAGVLPRLVARLRTLGRPLAAAR
jgi:cysteine desulfurase